MSRDRITSRGPVIKGDMKSYPHCNNPVWTARVPLWQISFHIHLSSIPRATSPTMRKNYAWLEEHGIQWRKHSHKQRTSLVLGRLCRCHSSSLSHLGRGQGVLEIHSRIDADCAQICRANRSQPPSWRTDAVLRGGDIPPLASLL